MEITVPSGHNISTFCVILCFSLEKLIVRLGVVRLAVSPHNVWVLKISSVGFTEPISDFQVV